MTDLRKAAEQALEALEWINRVNAMDYEYQQKAREPIQALRQALNVDAVNMSQERVDETAKGEQEPECVAVIGNWGKVEWKEGVFPQLGDKLYTAPPKREWVGLTRRELDIATLNLGDLEDCYIAIETKLKEKNNG